MPSPHKSRYQIPMLDRSLRVLELLAAEPAGLGVADLSRKLSAPKSSVFKILATLEQDGYIRPADSTNKFVLTTKLYRLGSAAVEQLNLKRTLYPLLVELAQKSGETANLGILDGGEATYIESIEGVSRVRVAVTPGAHIELHCTALGKVLLAYLPPEQAAHLLKGRRLKAHTPHTITNIKTLNIQLAKIRKQGFALDDEEDHLDIRCLGAPIRDYTGAIVAAVSMTAPKHHLPDNTIAEKAALVTGLAARMSSTLGYEG
jgi:IclR family transcriptional regulator, KDG regulon repressor